MKTKINIVTLARECGVEIVTTEEKYWGGKYGYREKDSSSTHMGYGTERAALMAWFKGSLGSTLGEVLLRDYLRAE